MVPAASVAVFAATLALGDQVARFRPFEAEHVQGGFTLENQRKSTVTGYPCSTPSSHTLKKKLENTSAYHDAFRLLTS